MKTVRTAKCVFCTFSQSLKPSRAFRRTFSSSLAVRRRETNPSAQSSAKTLEFRSAKAATSSTKPESNSQDNSISSTKQWTQEQQAIIDTARDMIEPKQLKKQRKGDHAWRLKYRDDFDQIHPVIDKPVRAPWENLDPNARVASDNHEMQQWMKLMRNLPDENDDEAVDKIFTNFDKQFRVTDGSKLSERHARSALAPEIPTFKEDEEDVDEAVTQQKKQNKKDSKDTRHEEEPSPALIRLMQMTGYSRRELAGLRVKSIVSHRVVNQTRLGKIGRQYFLSIAGNGQGLIGIGEGKSEEPGEARLQSQYRAIRNMQPILRYENRTIFGNVKGKVSATELELFARPPGFGLRTSSYIWEICKCAGIQDLSARVTRARNPMNTVKAAVQALLSQKNPEDIARARGKKLVDVRKVYYAGNV